MQQVRIISVVLIFLFIIQSCSSVKNIPEAKNIKLPSSYITDSDSLNIGKLKIEELFTDVQLISLIRIAIENNQDVLVASQRIEMARANYKVEKGALLPSLNPEVSAGVRRYADYTIDGVGNFDTNLSPDLPKDKRIPNPTPDYFAGFRSSWEADIWGKLRNQKRAAYKRLLASEKGRLLVVTNLVAEVASSYYTLLALDAELKIIRKNIKLQKSALETTKLLKEGGISNELAVSQFTAQLLNTQSMEVLMEQEIIKTENSLNVLLGRFPEPILRGSPIQEQEIPSLVQAGIPSEMLLRRPDVQKAELELKASKLDVRAARAAFLPSLTITSFAGMNAFTTSVFFSNPGSIAFGLLGGLSAPLFNRNIVKANYRTAVAMNKESYYVYHKSIVSGYTEVVTNLKELENIKKVSELKEEEMLALERGVIISNDLFLAGYASYLDVINAQRNVLATELALTNTKKEQFHALIALYRALGGGWE